MSVALPNLGSRIKDTDIMNIEVEYKFALNMPIADFTKILKAKNYLLGKRKYEKTVMYDNQARIMQRDDGRIRLRQSGDRYSLSYKKPLPNTLGQPKKEIEYETEVGSFELIDKILHTMEFKSISSYEKHRTTILEKSVQITIDEYPYQTFVEIEGNENNILEIAIDLGFDISTHINLPADTLFNLWRKEKGLPESMHMSFADFDK